MSATAPPPVQPAAPAPAPPPGHGSDACPLCGTPLAPAQEWCLHCGAAARTRLAAAPNWKTPVIALGAVAVLSLGAIAAALVKLAGDTGPAPPAVTRTVTGPAAPALGAATAAQTTTAPPATVPGTATTAKPGVTTHPANVPGTVKVPALGLGRKTSKPAPGTKSAPKAGSKAKGPAPKPVKVNVPAVEIPGVRSEPGVK